MLNLISYILISLVSYLLVPSAVFIFLVNFDHKNRLGVWEALIYSAALGPALISLALYYTLLLIPHQTSFFYISTIIFIPVVYLLTNLKSVKFLALRVINQIKVRLKENRLVTVTTLVILTGLFVTWQVVVAKVPILRHDTFEYATWGKYLYETKAIVYRHQNIDIKTGFIYVALHGLTFPLYSTWNELVNNFMGSGGDKYFRSVTGWYWILIMCCIYYWVSKKDRLFALLAMLALAMAPAFGASFVFYHLDTYRIIFFLLAIVAFSRAILNEGIVFVVLSGIFGGLMINAHSLGVPLAAIMLATYAIFSRNSVRNRALNIIAIVLLIVLFGGIHYIFDTLYGTGWILTSGNI